MLKHLLSIEKIDGIYYLVKEGVSIMESESLASIHEAVDNILENEYILGDTLGEFIEAKGGVS